MRYNFGQTKIVVLYFVCVDRSELRLLGGGQVQVTGGRLTNHAACNKNYTGTPADAMWGLTGVKLITHSSLIKYYKCSKLTSVSP